MSEGNTSQSKKDKSDMTDSVFENLVSAWLDGRLDEEGSQALQQELRESEGARSKFREFTKLDVALHELADTSGMQGPAELIASATQHSSSHSHGKFSSKHAEDKRKQSQATRPPTSFSRSGPAAFNRLRTWYSALAVGLLLAISLFSYFNAQERGGESSAHLGSSESSESVEAASNASPRKPPAPVAILASADHAVWAKSQLELEQALYEGDSIDLLKGKARISIGFGAEIVADAPCSLTFLASDRVQLHHGDVAVDVAPWAKGFTVVTEKMDIVDLGTTFTVSATPGKKSETTVLKGLVRVHPSNDKKEQRRGLLILEGQRVSIDGQGSLENSSQDNVQQLLSRLDFGGASPYRPVVLNNTGVGLSVGDEDQHWQVVAGPEASFSGRQYATVCVPHERYLPNYPDTSQWISIADWQTAAPNSIYTFQAEFNLKDYDLSTMQLFGRFLADNGIAAVRVNGEPVEVQSWVDNVEYQPFGDPQFRFVNITRGLVHGRNVIEVDVRNGMMRKGKGKNPPLSAIPNPMALRVEWYAFGRQQSLVDVGNDANLLLHDRESGSPLLTLFDRSPGI